MSTEAFRRLLDHARHDAAFRQQLVEEPLAAMSPYALSQAERRWLLLPNFGWLIEGRLAGVGRPGSGAALAELRAAGVAALVSLSETPPPGDAVAAYDLPIVHIPIPDFTAPSLAQIERAVAAVDDFLARDQPTAVHCGAGLGRTGTMLACYLVRHGSDAGKAIAAVRARRPGSIETPEQEAVIAAYERRLAELRTQSTPASDPD